MPASGCNAVDDDDAEMMRLADLAIAWPVIAGRYQAH
jgi:hypothetical protein